MAYKRFTASAEQLKPDPRYNSVLIAKFVNCMMWDGKKSVAYRVFYDAMDIIAKKIKDVPPNEVFETAIENVKPAIEVRSRRVGGANYQVPMQVNQKRRQSLAIRWVLAACRGKKGRPMAVRLADELMAAYRREGDAMNQREMVHRMADANKAFAHFAW
ncbi:MAG: 30S ribosomal protein S7 [Planctomycetota bacterium]|nr:MAG: 30S ribosomal protein S7 [Planctomycetota bacterium]